MIEYVLISSKVLIGIGIIIGICYLVQKGICYLINHPNKHNKPIQKQQKNYQTISYAEFKKANQLSYDKFKKENKARTHYDFNPTPYNLPNQQTIVKDLYKEYETFDPIKTKVKNNRYDNLLHTDDWKSKRDKILKRDNYTCRYCGRHDGILQVHHKYYNIYPNGSKPDPWDYPDDALITLCNECHERVHQNKKIKTYYRKKYLHYYN